MGKLHEILAVEGDLEGVSKKVVEEAKNTFTKKPNHFKGSHKTLKMIDEERAHEEAAAEAHVELVTTVDKKLGYVAKSLMKYYDAVLQKEATNQVAKADLVVDGEIVASDLPATFLLGMETRLKTLRQLYETLPTLPPGVKWEKDESQGEGVFMSTHPEIRNKEEKSIKHHVTYEATEFHPAQIETWSENNVVGTFTTQQWSGMISTARKSELLGRIDDLIQAVKQARQRANSQEVLDVNVGQALFDFIHKS